MPLLIALTLLTGVVDAVSYLALGHVFVANMTGNVVFLGFAIAGAGGLSAASSLIALGAFLLGAVSGRRIGIRWGAHRGRLLRSGGAIQAGLVAIALAIALASAAPEPRGVRYAIIAVLAVAMGIQNAVAARLAVPELTTTVLTKTLTGLAVEPGTAARSRWCGAWRPWRRWRWAPRRWTARPEPVGRGGAGPRAGAHRHRRGDRPRRVARQIGLDGDRQPARP